MSTEATKKRDVRDSKQVIGKLSYEEFKIVCEELDVVESAIRELWKVANDTDEDKIRMDIYKWLIEMNVGKARQSTQIEGMGGLEITINSGTLEDEQDKD